MRGFKKRGEPEELARYKSEHGSVTWDYMQADAENGGDIAAKRCKLACIADQGGICAYCECDLGTKPHKIRVEHFHDKSDSAAGNNWALDWANMLAVCFGGQRAGARLRPKDMSCDAHKNYWAQKHDNPKSFEYLMLDPSKLPQSPSVFKFNSYSGEIFPDAKVCHEEGISLDMAARTIEILNLNCRRICNARKEAFDEVEEFKERLIDKKILKEEYRSLLIGKFLAGKCPSCMVAVRSALGPIAEEYIAEHGFWQKPRNG